MKSISENQVNEVSITKLLLNSVKCGNLTDMAFNRAYFDPTFPISIELHLTNRCNLRCEWCVDKPIRGNFQDIPYESLLGLLDFLEGKNIGVTIEGGGEPTVYRYFDKFVLACQERNINIGLITNGVKRLSDQIVRCFNWIRVSLDASTPEEYKKEKGKDCFDTILNNLQSIRESSKSVVLGASYVLTRRNYQNLPLLFGRLAGSGINYIRFRNVEEQEKLTLTKTMMEEVEQAVWAAQQEMPFDIFLSNQVDTDQSDNNGLPCIAHSLRSIIHAGGEVVLCEKRRHDPVVLGNIAEQDFSEIWNSQTRIQASKKLLDVRSQQGCKTCRITKFNELFYDLTQVKTSSFI